MRLVALLFAAACGGAAAHQVQDAAGLGDGSQHTDAASTRGDGATYVDGFSLYDAASSHAPADMTIEPTAFPSGCLNAGTNPPDGHHNPGQDCTGCHAFTLAGTVFAGLSSATAVENAIIDVIDSAGVSTQMLSSANGNFYTYATITFPARVRVTQCPNNQVMPDLVMSTGTTAGCNQSGCHAAGNRIHLP